MSKVEVLTWISRLGVVVEEGATFCHVLALRCRLREHFHDVLLLLQLEVRLQNLDRLFVNFLILHHLKLFHLVYKATLFGFGNHRVVAICVEQVLLAVL